MNYNLAKELKDARFPSKNNHYSEPTLSELIEACGDRFALHKRPEELGWMAWKVNSSSNLREQHHTVKSTGSTPEEAAARLWLALNKT